MHEGEYIVCLQGTVTAAVDRGMGALAGTIRDALERQAEAYPGDPPKWVAQSAYLKYDGDLYGLEYRASDVVVSTVTLNPASHRPTATDTATTAGLETRTD
ncbi:hypothetical protein [Halorientalis halophila]|uniref:hypothetical protein n=1 Tax=Halorientalis halophila TaxID=3108499 RepID=UPI003009E6D6